jgi:glycosyltransferase involved in cell wall biosynthesis
MKNPLISVIIPVYNTSQWLPRCLESVLSQPYPALEVIAVDDGSQDNSLEICRWYESREPRLKVIANEHAGLSHARNTALNAAHGDLFAFVDSDDWLGNDAYTLLVRRFLDTGADILLYGYNKTWDPLLRNDAKPCAQDGFLDEDRLLSTDEAFNFLMGNYYIKNYVWDKIYVRRLFDFVRFPEGKNFEDIGIMYRLFLAANEIAVVGKHYKYYYFQRPNSILHSFSLRSQMNYYEMMVKRYIDLRPIPYKPFGRLEGMRVMFANGKQKTSPRVRQLS